MYLTILRHPRDVAFEILEQLLHEINRDRFSFEEKIRDCSGFDIDAYMYMTEEFKKQLTYLSHAMKKREVR